MCWIQFETIGNSSKNLGPSQKALRLSWCLKLVTGLPVTLTNMNDPSTQRTTWRCQCSVRVTCVTEQWIPAHHGILWNDAAGSKIFTIMYPFQTEVVYKKLRFNPLL